MRAKTENELQLEHIIMWLLAVQCWITSVLGSPLHIFVMAGKHWRIADTSLPVGCFCAKASEAIQVDVEIYTPAGVWGN